MLPLTDAESRKKKKINRKEVVFSANKILIFFCIC